jgi:fibronectin type 3 domain-containing protein
MMLHIAILIGSMTVMAAPGPHGMTIRWYASKPNQALVARVVRVGQNGTRVTLPDVQHVPDAQHNGLYAEIGTIETALKSGFATVDQTARTGARYTYDVLLSDGESGISNLTPRAGAKPVAAKMRIASLAATPQDRRIRLSVTPEQQGGYVQIYRSSGGAFVSVATVLCEGHGATVYSDAVPGGVRYAYRVAWMDAFGNVGPESAPLLATAKDFHHPAAIEGLRVQTQGSRVALSWSPSTDRTVRSYDIYRAYANHNPVRIASIPSSRSRYDDRVPEGSLVRYDVRARTVAGVEGFPSSGASLIVPKTAPPDAPSGLVAKPFSNGVELSWQPSRDQTITRYDVYRRAKNAAPFLLAQVMPSTRVYRVELPEGSGASYLYGVGARDRFGNRALPQRWVSAHALRALPQSAAPIAVTAAAGFAQVSLAPLIDPDVSAQQLYRSTDGAPAQRIVRLTPSATKYVDRTVRSGHRYAYSLAAVDRNGKTGVRSSQVSVAIAAAAPRAPSLSARLLGDHLTVELRWRQASGIVGYAIVRRSPNGQTVTIAPLVRAFAYRDVLLPGMHGIFAYALRIITQSGPSPAGPFTTIVVPGR